MTEERCVCCGEIIPEGRQVCLLCERKVRNAVHKRWCDEHRDHLKSYQKNYYAKHREHLKDLQKKWRCKRDED